MKVISPFAIRHSPFAICIVSLALLSMSALQPLLTAEFTCGYDNVLHLWRAVEADALLEHGLVYSRWQPHMAFGFGYPLLLFNPPISPLVAALFHRLGLVWPAAVNATFVAGTLLSAWTVWLLVREWWGDLAGVAAGVVIVTLPFHAYVNFHRASMSEALAWAFPALVLWGLIRWQKYGQRWGLLAAAGGEAALFLTHDAFAYLFFPLALVAIVALSLAHRSKWMLGRGILALALGMGLAAFFWLPSVLERSYVQFERVLDYPYAASFVAFDYMLEPPRTADPTWINPWLPKGIGLLPALLTLPAAATWLRAGREQRFWLAGIGLVTAGYAWLVLPDARPIWHLLPVLSYLHFPWRFLTPAVFGVAILGGAATHYTTRNTQRVLYILPPFVLGSLVLGATGWLYPPHCSLLQPATLPGMLAYERSTTELGGTTFNELLPVWVYTLPAERVLDDDLNAGREPVRLRPETLPKGARILHADYGPVDATIELDSPVTFHAHYLAFYYPGWRVTVDGDPVPVTPTDPDGLVSFDVPAGRHTIRVRFGETPLRLAADIISLFSLFTFAALMIRGPKRITHYALRTTHYALRITHYEPAIILITAILLLVAKLVLIDRVDTPLRHANLVDGHLRRVDVPAAITFGDEFVFLGHDALPASVPSGERFEVKTYWRALQPGGPDYGVTINVLDAQGHPWHDPDIRIPRWHRSPPPVREWPPDQYALMALSISALPGTPPGTFTVEVVAFDHDTLTPLTAHDADGRALGPALPLGQITVTVPRHPANPDALDIHQRLDTPCGPLTLLGADPDRDQAMPGDPVHLTLLWRATEQPAEDFTLRLALLASDSSPAAMYDLPPAVAWYPTSAWRTGDVWRGQHFIRLPAALDTSVYTWTLSLSPSLCSSIPLSSLSVTAPPRTFTIPPLDVEMNTRLDDVATLLGANVEPEIENLRPGMPLTITIVWRAETETGVSYRVFLHLVGPGGELVAQSDGEPANWARPTTGWLPGEVVLDERVLAIPEGARTGEYHLQAGMYTLEGGRLLTPEGADAVPIAAITIEAP